MSEFRCNSKYQLRSTEKLNLPASTQAVQEKQIHFFWLFL